MRVLVGVEQRKSRQDFANNLALIVQEGVVLRFDWLALCKLERLNGQLYFSDDRVRIQVVEGFIESALSEVKAETWIELKLRVEIKLFSLFRQVVVERKAALLGFRPYDLGVILTLQLNKRFFNSVVVTADFITADDVDDQVV